MAEPEYDEFGNILNLDLSLDNPTTYNIYENRAFNSGQGENLQNVYGIKGGIPMFQFIRQIKTGERTYDPTIPADRQFKTQYDQYQSENPQAPTWAEAIGETALGVAPRVGSAVGEALLNPGGYYEGDALSRATEGALDTFRPSPASIVNDSYQNFDPSLYTSDSGGNLMSSNQRYIGELANEDIAKEFGNTEVLKDLKGAYEPFSYKDKGLLYDTTKTANVFDTSAMGKRGYGFNSEGQLIGGSEFADPSVNPVGYLEGGDGALANTFDDPITSGQFDLLSTQLPPGGGGYASGVADQLSFSSKAGQSNYATGAGAGIFAAATTLVLTGDVEKAAKTGVGTAIGQTIGTAITLGNPIGTFIGGMIGGMLGGRVICNELCNQGLIDRKMLVNDYKFTRDYLTPSHVKGYHLWAIWMVKQMRKGRFVDLWSHIVIHRGNEIAYIYGERKKPDYLGKLYRKIFEPVCWILGAFSKQTDWSILYQKKEI